VGEINLSFVEYSLSKSVHLTPDIVEYDTGATAPLYDLIIGKQTLHDIGAVLDSKEKTITIDSILWPTRNIVNLQVKPSVTQEPISTPKATKRFIGILDAKHDKVEIPEIVRTPRPHLTPLHWEKLLSLLLKHELLFDDTQVTGIGPPLPSNWRTQPSHILAGHTANTQCNPNEGACGYRSAERQYHQIGRSDI